MISEYSLSLIKKSRFFKEFEVISDNTSCIDNFLDTIDLSDNKIMKINSQLQQELFTIFSDTNFKLKLLPNWTLDEYIEFENILKENRNVDTKTRWNIVKNTYNSHTFKECIELFKYVREQIEYNNNLKDKFVDISHYLDNHFVQLNQKTSTCPKILLINCNNLLTNNYNFENMNNPLIIVKGIDILIMDQDLKPEQIYLLLNSIISKISTYDKNNFFFCDQFFTWGFSLHFFAKLYNEQFVLTVEETIEKLWGDNYYDSDTKLWSNTKENKNIKRSFCQYILIPIKQLNNAILSNDIDKIYEISNMLNIVMEKDVTIDLNKIIATWTPFSKNFVKFLYRYHI